MTKPQLYNTTGLLTSTLRSTIEEEMSVAASQYSLALTVLILVLIISPIIILLVRRATNLIHVS